jgi:hypothetical protein
LGRLLLGHTRHRPSTTMRTTTKPFCDVDQAPLWGVCHGSISHSPLSRISRSLHSRFLVRMCGFRPPSSAVFCVGDVFFRQKKEEKACCCLLFVPFGLFRSNAALIANARWLRHVWALDDSGLGPPWAKPAWFSAIMDTKRPRVWATMGKNPLGFGLPWAKFTWVWAIMGTNTRGFGLPWAKIRLVLGYHGQSLLGFGRLWAQTPAGLGYHGQNPLGFGLPWAKFTWVWAITGKVYLGLGYHGQSLSGFGLLRARPFITAGLCDGGPL